MVSSPYGGEFGNIWQKYISKRLPFDLAVPFIVIIPEETPPQIIFSRKYLVTYKLITYKPETSDKGWVDMGGGIRMEMGLFWVSVFIYVALTLNEVNILHIQLHKIK